MVVNRYCECIITAHFNGFSPRFRFVRFIFDTLPSPTSLEVQSSPGQFHWFEYQTPIQSSSLGLFELHHAVRGRWAAEGNGSWKYWVKILMEWSQSPSQPQPNAHVLFGSMLATYLLMCSCFRAKADKVNTCGAHGLTRRPQNRPERNTTASRPAPATLLAGNSWFLERVLDDLSTKEQQLFLLLNSHVMWNTNA